MFATQLIGKKAIRTKPCSLSIKGEADDIPFMGLMGIGTGTGAGIRYDYSYTDEPLIILAATESHVIVKHPEDSFLVRHVGNEPRILDCRWCDENWTDYDELMKLAEPEVSKMIAEASGCVKDAP
jgi:hypothetical protein